MTTPRITLRDVSEEDLPAFFEYQRDPVAREMAAFGRKNAEDRDAFLAHWAKILADHTIIRKTILHDGKRVGHVMRYGWPERPELTFWIAREHWGKGIATRALAQLLESMPERPLYAGAAADNAGSLRVLEKCGFRITGKKRGFASGRGEEIDELLLELR